MSAPSTPAGFERFRAGRDAIMEEGNQAKQQAIKLDRSANESDQIMAGEYWWARHAASDKYRALLPNVAVSRCPFSGELLTWALDTVDLDGWAWNYDATVRRMPKPPKYFLAFTGAMRLHEPVTSKAIHVEPGPGVPGVIPHLFDWPNTIGVIAQIDVGPHIGWPIVYYTSSQPAKPAATTSDTTSGPKTTTRSTTAPVNGLAGAQEERSPRTMTSSSNPGSTPANSNGSNPATTP